MSFSRSSQPLHSISRLFGLLPFHIDRGRTGQILGEHIDFINLARSSMINLIYVASVIYTIIESNRKKSNLDLATDAVRFAEYTYIIVQIILNTSYIIFDIINRKRFVNILKKFDTFDEEVI